MAGFDEAIPLFLRTVSHTIVFWLPGLAASVLVLRSRTHDLLIAGFAALLGIAGSGYLAFWLWFFSPLLGRAFTFSLPLASATYLMWNVPRLKAGARSALKGLISAAALTGATALLILSIGFMFGGVESPLTTASERFSKPALPVDNQVPYLFAEGLRKGHVPKPLVGNWLSSDRPPLQTGIVLAQCLLHPAQMEYTVVSVIAQSLWIFGLWLFLITFDINSRCIMLVLLVSLFSGFVFVNGFFVWPKLLAAGYMLGPCGILLANRLNLSLQSAALLATIAGAMLAFALLAHSGTFFAIAGLALTVLVLRKAVTLKSLLIMAITCCSLYAPWILYQKLYDPPGDRLLKWHLAGAIQVDPRPFFQVFTEAYRNLSFHQFLMDKRLNFQEIVDHQWEYWQQIGALLGLAGKRTSSSRAELLESASKLRRLCFLYFFPNLGFLVLGLYSIAVGIFRRFRSKEWRLAAFTWLFIAFTDGIWCMLIFVPGGTVIFTGTYVVVLMSFAAAILALWAVSPRLAFFVGAIQIALNCVLYISVRESLAAASPAQDSLRYATAALALFAFASVALLLKKLGGDQRCTLPEATMAAPREVN